MMQPKAPDRYTWFPSIAPLPDIVTNWKSHSLSRLAGPTRFAGNVLLQHLEGGPWNFLTVARCNSSQDFATNEKTGVADTLKPDGGWLAIRNHSTYHNDTITDRIAP
jgi:hypothetical protein